MPSYRKRRDWRSRVRIWTVPVVAFLCLLWFGTQELKFRHRQQTAWVSAPATIEDTRLRPLAKFGFEYGGKDLYEVDVLATYSVAGQVHHDWVPLTTAPAPSAAAQKAASELKGKRCSVRWDPAVPDQRLADLL